MREWGEGEVEKAAGGTSRGGEEKGSEYQEEEMCAPPTNVSSKNLSADTGEEGKNGNKFLFRASNLDPETGSPVH